MLARITGRMQSLTLAVLLGFSGVLLGCASKPPEVIVITATFPSSTDVPLAEPTLTAIAAAFNRDTARAAVVSPPTSLPAAASGPIAATGERSAERYVVRPGDTLTSIASAHNVTLDALIATNSLSNPDALFVGQELILPSQPTTRGSDIRLLPDHRLVRGPQASQFDVNEYVMRRGGYLRQSVDLVNGELLTGAQIIERVALEFSIDPRLLLAALEYRAGWLSTISPGEEQRRFPMGAPPTRTGIAREGLYRQLIWTADQLNAGYYGWKSRNLSILQFVDGTGVRIAENLNPATVGIQYWLSRTAPLDTWTREVGEAGFIAVYRDLFGDPFADGDQPLISSDLVQPDLTLPFAPGHTWYYTGGPHGGYGSGSAWGAVDFAPPDDITQVESACYVSDFFAVAVADGVIARTAEGTVVLDLDGDGNEATGWSIFYLHIDERDRVEQGAVVRAGDPIGRPSCDGGFSNATHMHIARRYNGEWLPADCGQCRPEYAVPPFVLGGWRVIGFANQEYQGQLVRNGERLQAEQGRTVISNQISW